MISKDHETKIIKQAEAEARRGNVKAMNLLHLLDLMRSGERCISLDIPSDGYRRPPTKHDSSQSFSSSSSGW